MRLVVLRVWLPDRPGALGLVASRIGAVRGDLVGIDILERGAGSVVDELVVELPADVSDDLLVREVAQVDGVEVEEVREAHSPLPDPRLDVLEATGRVVATTAAADLLSTLVEQSRHVFGARWAAVVATAPAPTQLLAAVGLDVPPPGWITAFALGVKDAHDGAGPAGATDVLCASLERSSAALMIGRDGSTFRERERRQLTALATIADVRLAELRSRAGSFNRTA